MPLTSALSLPFDSRALIAQPNLIYVSVVCCIVIYLFIARRRATGTKHVFHFSERRGEEEEEEEGDGKKEEESGEPLQLWRGASGDAVLTQCHNTTRFGHNAAVRLLLLGSSLACPLSVSALLSTGLSLSVFHL